MCGIAGFATTRPLPDAGALLKRMADAIAHRGPDDDGYLHAASRDGSCAIGLAHRRLSIIDLSTGHQPLGNEDGSVQIVFNGEIYNYQSLRDQLVALGHRFATGSDTETIVHAYEQWGPECVQRFRGMFAFAIWDARSETLFLARDRFGKKPLFMWEGDGVLLFASEIKSLLEHPAVSRRVDLQALPDYFTYRYVPGPRTLFHGIRKLMPGSHASWRAGRLVETRYWSPPDAAPPADAAPAGDVVGAFLGRLEEAVRIRMIADVPFGAFLSGGIDSSAVVALMTRHSSQPVKTFSVGFAESNYSELRYAKDIADQFSTDHHELTVSENELMGHLPALVRFRDAPVAEPSDIPIYLLSVEARRTVKMVLTGEGSDEILGGYPKHVFERHAAGYQLLPRMVRQGLLEPLVRALPYRFRRVKTAVSTLGVEEHPLRMARWFGALSRRDQADLLAERFAPRVGVPPSAHYPDDPRNSALRRILAFDQSSWLLERGDRMTMAASLEGRMPFMDHELAAFASTLPDSWRVRGSATKRVLREAMQRVLPRHILERPKVGFRVPVNEWFRGSMQAYLKEHLLSAASLSRDYYRREALERMVAEHVEGRQNHEKLLWSLLTLEIWHREYRVSA
jgi:asparagine synthase (glutamine-hydrolysing)